MRKRGCLIILDKLFLSLNFEMLPKRNHGGQNRKKKNDKVIDRWTEIRIDFKI